MDFKKRDFKIGDQVNHVTFGKGIVVRLNMSGPIVYWYDSSDKVSNTCCVPSYHLEFYEDNYSSWYTEGKELLINIAKSIDSIGGTPEKDDLRRYLDLQVTTLHRRGMNLKHDDLDLDQ